MKLGIIGSGMIVRFLEIIPYLNGVELRGFMVERVVKKN